MSTVTASMAIQPAKHQLTLEISAEGQQTAWPEDTGTSTKRPRLELVDGEAASDLQISSPSIVMSSSRQHPSEWHPPSQFNEPGNASTYESFGENGSMMEPLQTPHPLQLSPFYPPWAPSPLAGQTEGYFGSFASPIPNSIYPGDDEDLHLFQEFTHLSPGLKHGAAVFESIPTLPAESLSSSQTSQKIASVANTDTQRDQLQPETPQNSSCSSSQEQTTPPVPNTEVITQVPPLEDTIEKQTRQFSSTTGTTSYTLTFSKPAQGTDLNSFPWIERHLISAYTRNEQGKKDVDFMKWFTGIRRPFWAHTMRSSGIDVPSSLYDRVLDELCASHPCRHDPWTGHDLYRSLLGKNGTTCLMTLEKWMYGKDTTTLSTWRDTMSTKIGSSRRRKVPWVQREKIIALSVLLACADAASKEMRSAGGIIRMKNNIKSKFGILEKCKLTYLLSNQDHVVANEYWDGLAEELEEDPKQEHLYDKVVREKQLTTPGSSIAWSSSPTHSQEAQGEGDQSRSGSPRQSQPGDQSGQAGPGGNGDSQILADVEQSIPQYPVNHEPFNLAQQYLPPAENINQDTEQTPNVVTQETSLQDRVRKLEGEVAELHRYIRSMHQQFPALLAPPPRASSQHQP